MDGFYYIWSFSTSSVLHVWQKKKKKKNPAWIEKKTSRCAHIMGHFPMIFEYFSFYSTEK